MKRTLIMPVMPRAAGEPRRGRERWRTGVVLLAVMIAVVLISASASVVLLRADAQATRTVSMLRHSQSRAAAWSGVKGVLAELASQRGVLVQGGEPSISASITLVDATERAAVVARLVSLVPGEATMIQSEAAKVNINTVDEAALEGSTVLDGAELAIVLEHRRAAPLSSLAELCGPPGLSIERLYGRVLGAEPTLAVSMPAEASVPTAASPGGAVAGAPGGVRGSNAAALSDVCTVFSADPTIQVGIGPDASSYTGAPRINLGLGWSDELAGPIAERFGTDAVQTTRQLLQGGTKFGSMRDVVGVLKQLGVPTRQWGSLLDAFTTSTDPFELGKVDTLRASAAVLATVPGIDASAAERMVAVRDRLDAAVRREITWPLIEGILTPEQFEQAVDWITNRSLQWRVIVEAGRVRRSATNDTTELTDRVVYEAVLDVAGRVPRVAYLRDVTAMPAVRAMALAPETDEGDVLMEFATDTQTDGLPAAAVTPSDAVSLAAEPAPADEGETAIDEPPAEAVSAAPVPAGVDRRNGRWMVRRGGGS